MVERPIVHIVDDDDTLRDSLAFVLNSVGIETLTFNSASAFIEALRVGATGCVITDVRMPGMSGIDLLTRLRDLGSDLDVIVVTGHGDVPLAVEAMRLGASDFVEKPFRLKEFAATVRAVLDRAIKRTEKTTWASEVLYRISTLSVREQQVLSGLIDGKSNKTIAYELGISSRTVEVHRSNLMLKMKASSLSELVRMGLITSSGQSSKTRL